MEDRVSNGALVKGMIAKYSRRHGIEGWSSVRKYQEKPYFTYHVTKLLFNDLHESFSMRFYLSR
jgi:hypothetical protein